MGVPGVHEVRSTSMFGASLIFLIFDDDVEFYWSRARINEKLNSLPAGLLPADAQPRWGPTRRRWGRFSGTRSKGATPTARRPAAGTCTSCGRCRTGRCGTPCWRPRASARWRRSVASCANTRWTWIPMRCAPTASPSARWWRPFAGATWTSARASRRSTAWNTCCADSGFIRDVADIEQATVRGGRTDCRSASGTWRRSGFGPRSGAGALTKMGAEAVGGVVVVREGYNPLEAIRNVKAKIDEIRPGLPSRAVVDWSRTGSRRAGGLRGTREGFEPFCGCG
jgi:copper/silver efflux system protein